MVLRCVPRLGRVAASNVPAGQAEPEVNPGAVLWLMFLAARCARIGIDAGLLKVAALLW